MRLLPYADMNQLKYPEGMVRKSRKESQGLPTEIQSNKKQVIKTF